MPEFLLWMENLTEYKIKQRRNDHFQLTEKWEICLPKRWEITLPHRWEITLPKGWENYLLFTQNAYCSTSLLYQATHKPVLLHAGELQHF